MVCLYCRKKIGLVRRFRDRSFCCSDHRKRGSSMSARALREAEDLYGYDEERLPTWRTITEVRPEDKGERRPGYAATIFATLAVVFVLLAVSDLPLPKNGPRSPSPPPGPGPHPGRTGFGRSLPTL